MTLTGKAAKNRARRRTQGDVVELYRDAAGDTVDAYLSINQPSEPERVARILAAAQDRRERRKAKHKPKVFQIDLRKEANGEV